MQNQTNSVMQMMNGIDPSMGIEGFPSMNIETAGEINPEKRFPLEILVDTSRSTFGDPINEMNDGLARLILELAKDEIASVAVDLCITEFNDTVNVVYPFANVGEAPMPILRARGLTKMGGAIIEGLKLLRQRQQEYNLQGIPSFKPMMILLTDGMPTDEQHEWQSAVARLRQAQQQQEINFLAVGYNGADMSALKELSCQKPPAMLQGIKFLEFFEWLSKVASIASSSQPGMTTTNPLPSPDSWMQGLML